ncbi:hypothetical protein [Methylobacterium sp. WCS2018Hpa-22]|uniref:hypothetical protein n=1 Tax=Methylobacterium sp. WCS2018Hpa-22 TaxID=3073633 RepID=UPI00288B3502|nr:hypothetical protein [Methylobacterium sp. WCS2018Hpa-22]
MFSFFRRRPKTDIDAALVEARAILEKARATKFSIEREGYVLVPAEVVALAAYVVNVGGIGPQTLPALLLDLGLATKDTFDPEVHVGNTDEDLKGDSWISFTPKLLEAIRIGRAHLKGWNGGIH